MLEPVGSRAKREDLLLAEATNLATNYATGGSGPPSLPVRLQQSSRKARSKCSSATRAARVTLPGWHVEAVRMKTARIEAQGYRLRKSDSRRVRLRQTYSSDAAATAPPPSPERQAEPDITRPKVQRLQERAL